MKRKKYFVRNYKLKLILTIYELVICFFASQSLKISIDSHLQNIWRAWRLRYLSICVTINLKSNKPANKNFLKFHGLIGHLISLDTI